jgi:hypothetical protein
MEWAVAHQGRLSKLFKKNPIAASDEFFDSIGSNAFSVDDAKVFRDDLSSILDTQKELGSARRRKNAQINKVLGKYKDAQGHTISGQARKEIAKALNAGDTARIPKILQTYAMDGSDVGMSDTQIEALMNGETGLSGMLSDYANLQDREKRARFLTEDDRKSARKRADAVLKKVGLEGKLDLTKKTDVEKFIRYMDTEIKAKDATPEAKAQMEANKISLVDSNNIKEIKEYIRMIATHGVIVQAGDDEKTAALAKEREEAFNKAMEDTTTRSKSASDVVRNIIGQENYDKLDDETKEHYRGATRDRVVRKWKETPASVNVSPPTAGLLMITYCSPPEPRIMREDVFNLPRFASATVVELSTR